MAYNQAPTIEKLTVITKRYSYTSTPPVIDKG
jgi:hypothetical protein